MENLLSLCCLIWFLFFLINTVMTCIASHHCCTKNAPLKSGYLTRCVLCCVMQLWFLTAVLGRGASRLSTLYHTIDFYVCHCTECWAVIVQSEQPHAVCAEAVHLVTGGVLYLEIVLKLKWGVVFSSNDRNSSWPTPLQDTLVLLSVLVRPL